jgi:excisionase family DNA binding protein
MDQQEFLRPLKAFALLDISKSRGYEAIQKGEIPHLRIGGLIRVPKRWIEEQVRDALATASSSHNDASSRR